MKVAYTSRRPFADGPVTSPIPENDPVNIAYVLQGDYFSFFTLDKLSAEGLQKRLAPYDLVFVPLDLRALESVQRIAQACNGRYATYSEGNIADYQMLSPTDQIVFLSLINRAAINFLYWEKYVPFYQALTNRPVVYLPYPFLYEEAGSFRLPRIERARQVTLPSGLAGSTRNGLASLAVAKILLEMGLIERVNCWLTAVTFAEDVQAVQHFVLGTPFSPPKVRWNWRQWLLKSGLDYRKLLALKKNRSQGQQSSLPPKIVDGLGLYRRQTWHHYLPEAAKTMAIIDMNNRETVGRNALDAAVLGIPCVSTDRSDMQPRLFPATTLADSWDIDGAVALCHKLLQDDDFYEDVIAYAAQALTGFGREGFLQRWQEVVAGYWPGRPQES
ncbi:MAG: hypothetical protein H6659_00385 [Ardenticatenaceae bacterium]|nr:hypothetical protein [Ardenticatenaceae bacterium]MCB8987052.1 hypothetical protein [Ardenticatenaceae bacterium]